MPTKFIDPKPEVEFDQPYRYWWKYRWSADGPLAAWLMMNPSWASSEASDRTVDRVIHFSRQHGCGGAIVVNLWPLITPKSGVMWRNINSLPSKVIERNCDAIRRASDQGAMKVAAFGLDAGRDHPKHTRDMVSAFGDGLVCLGASQDGWPYHPMVRGKLYIPDDRRMLPWSAPATQAVVK